MQPELVPLVFIFIAVISLVVVIGIAIYIANKRRMEAFRALAFRLGITFDESKNYNLAEQYGVLNKLAQGSNRYFFNTLAGLYKGYHILVSDYHYETHSIDSKGRSKTNHYHLSLFTLQLPAAFPELTIVREGLFSKIAQAFGYADIDFESAEFSRAFCVRSPDKKFAYDVCNAKMLDYLLENKDLSIEIERNMLAIVFDTQLAIEKIKPNLGRLLEIRSRMPNYLFERA